MSVALKLHASKITLVCEINFSNENSNKKDIKCGTNFHFSTLGWIFFYLLLNVFFFSFACSQSYCDLFIEIWPYTDLARREDVKFKPFPLRRFCGCCYVKSFWSVLHFVHVGHMENTSSLNCIILLNTDVYINFIF